MEKEKKVEFFGGKAISTEEQEKVMGGQRPTHPCPGCRCSNSVQGFEGTKMGIILIAVVC